MKRVILIILIAWLLVRLGALDMLLALMFAGIIPGTSMALPAGFMLTAYLVAAVLLFHHFVLAGKAPAQKRTQSKKRRTSTPRRTTTRTRRSPTKRRYSEA